MNIQYHTNGNLEMIPTTRDIRAIKRLKKAVGTGYQGEADFIEQFLEPKGFRQVTPESIGALTDAACIQDKDGKTYANMNYQIQSFMEEMILTIFVSLSM